MTQVLMVLMHVSKSRNVVDDKWMLDFVLTVLAAHQVR